MRATKLIKEYVEKQVKARFPKSMDEILWDHETERMSKAITEANEKIEEYAQKIVAELNEKYNFSEEYKLKEYRDRCYVSNTSTYDCKNYLASRKAREAREKKINETIENILITLELGGTKAELEEMLNNIG